MKKKFFVLIPLVLISVVVIWKLFLQKTPLPSPAANPSPTPASISSDEAFKNALNLYIQKKSEGVDMADGPCLGKVADDWVLDIAHNPRKPVDDMPENQCDDYRSGTVKHFIELDPDGKLLKAQ